MRSRTPLTPFSSASLLLCYRVPALLHLRRPVGHGLGPVSVRPAAGELPGDLVTADQYVPLFSVPRSRAHLVLRPREHVRRPGAGTEASARPPSSARPSSGSTGIAWQARCPRGRDVRSSCRSREPAGGSCWYRRRASASVQAERYGWSWNGGTRELLWSRLFFVFFFFFLFFFFFFFIFFFFFLFFFFFFFFFHVVQAWSCLQHSAPAAKALPKRAWRAPAPSSPSPAPPAPPAPPCTTRTTVRRDVVFVFVVVVVVIVVVVVVELSVTGSSNAYRGRDKTYREAWPCAAEEIRTETHLRAPGNLRSRRRRPRWRVQDRRATSRPALRSPRGLRRVRRPRFVHRCQGAPDTIDRGSSTNRAPSFSLSDAKSTKSPLCVPNSHSIRFSHRICISSSTSCESLELLSVPLSDLLFLSTAQLFAMIRRASGA